METWRDSADRKAIRSIPLRRFLTKPAGTGWGGLTVSPLGRAGPAGFSETRYTPLKKFPHGNALGAVFP